MLADAIGSALLLVGFFAGIASLVVAVGIETPLLRLLWGRRRIWRWVVVANVASFAVGVVPTILMNVIQAPGPSADPWEWYQTFWVKLLAYAGALFVLTLIVEGAIYLRLNHRAAVRVSTRRLLLATVAANVASYVPLTAYLLHAARDTGDFALAPDTRWVRADDTRVYFVDQRTNQVNSIRLDGSDRRLELPATLGRFETDVEASAFYAILKDDARILYVGVDRHWHAAEADGDRTLRPVLPECHDRAFRGDLAVSLQQALAEIGVERPVPTYDEALEGVYLSGTMEFYSRAEPVEIGEYWISGGTSPYVGAGPGLYFSRALRFGIWAAGQNLACGNPAPLPDGNTVVFRCGSAIMVLDLAGRRVGRLAHGDSLVLKLPQFSKFGLWWAHSGQATTNEAGTARGEKQVSGN